MGEIKANYFNLRHDPISNFTTGVAKQIIIQMDKRKLNTKHMNMS
jgi:hypothetical protein